MKHIYINILLFCIFIFNASAENEISISVTPSHSDWIYNVGVNAIFDVKVKVNNDDLSVQSISYEVGYEKMPPLINGNLNPNDRAFSINGGTMNIPGFLRCTVTVNAGEKSYKAIATAAFNPEKIQPTIKEPSDFDSFWNNVIEESNKIPLDLKLTPILMKSNDSVNYYQVDYHNNEYKSRSYGVLTVPVKPGKYPAVLRFPGAGVHPTGGNTLIAGKNVITLDLYIHPFSVLNDVSFYDTLKNSPYIDYKFIGSSNKDSYYYKKVIAGCVRAVDVIYSLPEFDGKNLAAWGSSQGGALSIITTSLDKRIKMLVVLCPAMCDYTGYLFDRAGGWPHFFSSENIDIYNNEKVLETLPYFDVVNFAKRISVPGFYSWGFNDETTPPTSFYSAYNQIKASKKIFIIPEGVHKIYPEQVSKTNQWIFDSFNYDKKNAR